MLVSQLITNIQRARVRGTLNNPVVGITHNSRTAGPGIVFVALPEEQRANPYQAIAAAERGAAAVICPPGIPLPERGTCITVSDPSEAYALAAAELFEHPSEQLRTILVRGPRSRVVASLLQQLLRASGTPCGLLTECGCEVGDRRLPQAVSRLEAVTVQESLRYLVRNGCKACVIEASAATDAARNLAGVKPAATLEIEPAPTCLDDPASTMVAGSWRAENLLLTASAVHFNVNLGRSRIVVRSPLVGRSIARDLLYAVRAAHHLGLDPQALNRAAVRLRPVSGAMAPVRVDQPFGVYVDAARTGAELAAVLRDAAEITRGRLSLVIGGSADHTTAQRVELGRVAGELADEVLVTSDNPRELDPSSLARDILHGVHATPSTGSRVELDRCRAIRRVLRGAFAGDSVVIAGKGYRCLQEIEGSVVPFDDFVVARESLAERGYIGSEI